MTKEFKTCLVGDIGGTNVRLAVADLSDGTPKLGAPKSLPHAGVARFEDVVDRYLKDLGNGMPDAIVVAVAGPIKDGEVRLTNGQWSISEKSLRAKGFGFARLINDYAALGYAVEHLKGDDLAPVGGNQPGIPGETVGVLGAGTGLGVAALVRDAHASSVMVTEGGHIAYAPVDEVEFEILKVLRTRFCRVSVERLLSGPGLANIHWALAQIGGIKADPLTPEEISRRAAAKTDQLCVNALDRFCGVYGRYAGDMALAFGARGGIYLGGGIAPKLLVQLNGGTFRRCFEDKGRFVGYVSIIPTKVIVHPFASLLGSAEAALRSLADLRG
ncbi:MAG TPA: glucokinase [Rhizomicrobium sp.]|nr:glucokinase [Rhizomicrobium sp.]